MENKEQTYEEIELYLKGKLSGYDKIHFEEKLLTDSEFAQKVRYQKAANNVIISRQLESLKKRMENDLAGDFYSGNYSKGLWALLSVTIILTSVLLIFYPASDSINKKDVESNSQSPDLTAPVKEPYLKNKTSHLLPKIQSNIISENRKISLQTKNDTLITQVYTQKESITKEEERNQSEDLAALNNASPSYKTIHCAEHPSFPEADITASCKGKNDGIIVLDIQHIKGGTYPYQYSIDNGKSFSDDYIFRQLEAGTYHILIKDKNNCIVNNKVIVPEKKCLESSHYVVNPLNGNWKIPVTESRSGELKIFNKTGILVFSKSVSESQENEWDGKSDYGLLLPVGYYAFVIHYENGEEESGHISIMY